MKEVFRGDHVYIKLKEVISMNKVLLIGEPMELLLAKEEGALSDVSEFRASVSGAEMNVAVGLSRLGLCPRFMTRLGSDPRASRRSEERR